MDESNFHELADALLSSLADSIEMAAADEEGKVEVDFIDGVLNITFDNGSEMVINKHAPTSQIWVSSPNTGASRFSYNEEDDEWANSAGHSFKEAIAEELSDIADLNIDF